MKLEKILYSKCPNCKEHGIPMFKTARFFQPTLICKKCGEKYKANGVLAVFLVILTPCVLFLFDKLVARLFRIYLNAISIAILLLIAILVIEYFLPIENIDEDK